MSEIVTTTGQSIDSYPDYKTGKTAEQQAAFVQTAKIPVAGKYDASSDTVETKTVTLESVIGGGAEVAAAGGLEMDANGKMQLQGIGNSADFEMPYRTSTGIKWKEAPSVHKGDGISVSGSGSYGVSINLSENSGLEFEPDPAGDNSVKVSNPVPAPGTNQNRGKVLTVNSSDQVVWNTAPSSAPAIDDRTIIVNDNDELEVQFGVGLTFDFNSGGICPDIRGLGLGNSGYKVKTGDGLTLNSDDEVCIDTDSANQGDVLTMGADGVVWAAPSGGDGGIPEIPADHASKGYVLGINSDGTLAWKCISNGSGGASPYVD